MLIEQTYCAGALCKGFGIGGRQKIPACLGLVSRNLFFACSTYNPKF